MLLGRRGNASRGACSYFPPKINDGMIPIPPEQQCFGEIKNGVLFFEERDLISSLFSDIWVDSIRRWLKRKSLLMRS